MLCSLLSIGIEVFTFWQLLLAFHLATTKNGEAGFVDGTSLSAVLQPTHLHAIRESPGHHHHGRHRRPCNPPPTDAPTDESSEDTDNDEDVEIRE